MRRPVLAPVALGIALYAAPAQPQPAAPATRELRLDPALDLSVVAVGGGAWVASEILKDHLAPASCRWCASNGVDDGVRNALVWSDTSTPNAISNVTAFVVAPLAAIGSLAAAAVHDDVCSWWQNGLEDGLVVLEATVIAADANQLTKFLVGRERPFVHALPDDRKGLTAQPSDNDLSFFSGHTTETFALAAAAGTVATMRGYRAAPVVWAIGGALAATTAYMRIAADKHWFTDVAVGMIVGAGAGIALPWVFHRPAEGQGGRGASALSVGAAPGGVSLALAW